LDDLVLSFEKVSNQMFKKRKKKWGKFWFDFLTKKKIRNLFRLTIVIQIPSPVRLYSDTVTQPMGYTFC
jgi:hypothetical protein